MLDYTRGPRLIFLYANERIQIAHHHQPQSRCDAHNTGHSLTPITGLFPILYDQILAHASACLSMRMPGVSGAPYGSPPSLASFYYVFDFYSTLVAIDSHLCFDTPAELRFQVALIGSSIYTPHAEIDDACDNDITRDICQIVFILRTEQSPTEFTQFESSEFDITLVRLLAPCDRQTQKLAIYMLVETWTSARHM